MSSDSDTAADYRALNIATKAKRAANREQSAELLREAGISFTACNDGAHLIVASLRHPDGPTVDFWPGTGRWQVRGHVKPRFGVKALLAYLTKDTAP